MSYGTDYVDLFRRAGDYVDKILRGTKPGDLPVEQPTKFELIINLKTAKALGLDHPADAARPRRRDDRMKRREFIAMLGGAAAMPLAARARQSTMPVIGFLSRVARWLCQSRHRFPTGAQRSWIYPGPQCADRIPVGGWSIRPAAGAGFRTGRPAGGSAVRRRGANLGERRQAAMATTPVVFTTAFDPVQAGLVASLNQPGGNTTGVSFEGRALTPKRIELIRELLPKATTVALLHNPKYPLTSTELADVRTASNALALQLRLVPASTVAEIDQAFVQLNQQRPDAILLNPDLLFLSQRELLLALAARHEIPAFYPMDEFTRAGGLISYGASTVTAYRQAGDYAGRILKGIKPADLPVLLPTKFDVVINLKTAKALGLTVADSFVLFRVDEVIE